MDPKDFENMKFKLESEIKRLGDTIFDLEAKLIKTSEELEKK